MSDYEEKKKDSKKGQPKEEGGQTEHEQEVDTLKEQIKKLEKEKTLLIERYRETQIELINADNKHKAKLSEDTDKAVSEIIKCLLPTFDNINRARSYDQITGVLATIVSSFENTFKEFGLVDFGEEGDEFNPHIHEAISTKKSDDKEATADDSHKKSQICCEIVEKGFFYKDILLRSAKVIVELK
jgi:molecular chaperone GrpE